MRKKKNSRPSFIMTTILHRQSSYEDGGIKNLEV